MRQLFTHPSLVLCMEELERGVSRGIDKWRLALFASVWHGARVITKHALDPEAQIFLDLCDEFAYPVPKTEKYLENRLLDLYQQHKRYAAAKDNHATTSTMGC
jgi:hypothetical protein